MVALDIWNHNDFMHKNYILNRLNNTQYNVYNSIKSANALQKVLDKKFKFEDVVMKKLIFDKFLNLKVAFESNKFILSKNGIRIYGWFC